MDVGTLALAAASTAAGFFFEKKSHQIKHGQENNQYDNNIFKHNYPFVEEHTLLWNINADMFWGVKEHLRKRPLRVKKTVQSLDKEAAQWFFT